MREAVSDVYTWLGQELQGMMPWRRKVQREPVVALLRLTREGVVIEPPPGRSKQAPFVAKDPREAIEALKSSFASSRFSRQSVDVILAPERYLKRRLSDLCLPRSRLEAMARLDIQASTPFRPEEVHVICYARAGPSGGSGYYIVKRTFIDPVLKAVRTAKFSVASFRFAADSTFERTNQTAPLYNSSLDALIQPPLWARFWSGLTTAAIVAVVLGAILTAGHARWRMDSAGAVLDDAIAAAKTEAGAVRRLISSRNQKIQQISLVRRQKQASVPVAVIIEEMARVIPDSAWLTEIEIRDSSVSFAGIAKSAAALIPILEESKLFRSPTFKAPVVRAGNQQGEHFRIAMEVEKTDG